MVSPSVFLPFPGIDDSATAHRWDLGHGSQRPASSNQQTTDNQRSMKRILSLTATVVVVALTFVGCGDDGPSEPVNTYLTFKVGDQFTYNYYQRDSSNQRVDASKQVRKWTVLRTDLSYNGRTTATEVEEQVFDATGTTLAYRDTLYFSSTGQGKVEQYDIVGNFLALIPFAAAYRDSVAPTWVQIGDVKTTGALSWVSLPTIQVNNVQVPVGPSTISVNIQLTMNASHKGKINVTTPAETFTNNFRTDHSLKFTVLSAGIPLLTDSLQTHYDVDTKGGVTKNSADSRSITFSGSTVDIPGYEMELVSYTRAQ